MLETTNGIRKATLHVDEFSHWFAAISTPRAKPLVLTNQLLSLNSARHKIKSINVFSMHRARANVKFLINSPQLCQETAALVSQCDGA